MVDLVITELQLELDGLAFAGTNQALGLVRRHADVDWLGHEVRPTVPVKNPLVPGTEIYRHLVRNRTQFNSESASSSNGVITPVCRDLAFGSPCCPDSSCWEAASLEPY